MDRQIRNEYSQYESGRCKDCGASFFHRVSCPVIFESIVASFIGLVLLLIINAFRHAYWMALISRRYGSGWAISFGEAYEADNTRDGKDEADVDRHNNDFGAYLGRERTNSADQQLAVELEALVNRRNDQLDYSGCC